MINYGPTQPESEKKTNHCQRPEWAKRNRKKQEHSKGEKKREGDYFIKM